MKNDTRQMLERHFDTAFAAPDGIRKLRELILTLAMQGKLVAQDPKDPPASELLKEIEAEKQRLVKEGKIKASREGAKGDSGRGSDLCAAKGVAVSRKFVFEKAWNKAYLPLFLTI